MAKRNLRGRRGRGRAAPATARAALGVDDEEMAAWRDAAAAMRRPLRRASSACTRRPTASPAPASGTSTRRRRTSTRCCCTPVLRPLPQAGRQAGRPRAGAVRCAATRSRPRRRRATSRTTRRSRCATRRCRRACRRSSRPRPATSTSPTTTSARRRFVDLHDLDAQHARRPAHRGAGRAPGSRSLPASAACATTAGRFAFAPRLPERIGRLRSGCASAAGGCASTSGARGDVRASRPARRSRSPTTARRSSSRPGDAVTRPIPPAPRRDRPRQPPGREPRRRTPDRPGPPADHLRSREAGSPGAIAQSGARCSPPPANAARMSSGQGIGAARLAVDEARLHRALRGRALVARRSARRYSTDARPSAVTLECHVDRVVEAQRAGERRLTATRGVAPNVKSAIPSAVCSAASAASASRNTVVQ